MPAERSATVAAIADVVRTFPEETQLSVLLYVNKVLAKLLAQNRACPYLRKCRFGPNLCWFKHPENSEIQFTYDPYAPLQSFTQRRQRHETNKTPLSNLCSFPHRNPLSSETTASAVANLGDEIADIPGTSSTPQASAEGLYNSFNQTSIDFSNYNDKSVSTSTPKPLSGGFQTSRNCQKEFENTNKSKQQPPNKKHYDQQRYDSHLSGYGDLQANMSQLSGSQSSDNDTSTQSESGSWKIAQNKKWKPCVKKPEVLEPRPICKNCSNEFVITESANKWFLDRSLQIPRRCEACRQGTKVLTRKNHPAPRLLFVPDLTPPVLRHSDTIGDRVPSFTHVNFPTLQSHVSHIGRKFPSNKGNTTLRVDSEVHDEESQSSDAATHSSVSNTHEDKPKGHRGKEKREYDDRPRRNSERPQAHAQLLTINQREPSGTPHPSHLKTLQRNSQMSILVLTMT